MTAAAIAGTSANTNRVALLNLPESDLPTQAQMQAIANKLDELITTLRRQRASQLAYRRLPDG